MKFNIWHAIILVISVYAIITTFEKRKIESKYNAEIEKGITIINDSIDKLNLQIKDLSIKLKTKTKNIQKGSKDINDKLKQDEKDIDNSIVNDDELKNFISKHENR